MERDETFGEKCDIGDALKSADGKGADRLHKDLIIYLMKPRELVFNRGGHERWMVYLTKCVAEQVSVVVRVEDYESMKCNR